MSNSVKYVLIGFILIGMLSLFFLIPLPVPNFYIAYIFAIIGILGFIGNLLYISRTNVKIPGDLIYKKLVRTYLIINLIISIVGVPLIANFPVYFLILHMLLLGVFGIRFLNLSSQKEIYGTVGDKAKANVDNIRFSLADLESIKHKAMSLESPQKDSVINEIQRVYDALRYSDPITPKDLKDFDSRIQTNIKILNTEIENGNVESALKLCQKIYVGIHDRTVQIKNHK